MKTVLRTLLTGGLITASISLIGVSGCGGDDDDDGNNAGSSGRAGSGTGGARAGGGGASGSGTGGTGTGGTQGGTTGKAGNTGDAGAAGDAGASGGGGEGGLGGAGGAGGDGGDGGADPGGPTPACTAYCTAIMTTCSGGNLQYPTQEQCLASCAAYPSTGSTSGNSIECRGAHAVLAATTGVVPHCAHSGPAAAGPGSPPCGGPCPSYCSLMLTFCPESFANLGACTASCQGTPGGAVGSEITTFDLTPPPSGDTLECRIFHATNAALYDSRGDTALRTTHCRHAAGLDPVVCAAP